MYFKQNTGSAQISELSPSPVEEILTTQEDADTSTVITGTQWMKRFIQPIESPEKTEGDETISAAEAAGDSARKKKKFIK